MNFEITAADLAADIQKHTAGSPQEAQKRPLKPENGFPLGIYSPKLQELLRGAKTALGMPIEFTGAATMLAASVATGNTYRLKLKKAQYQKAIFWLLLVARPNINKTASFFFPFKPIRRAENENHQTYLAQLAEYRAEENPTGPEPTPKRFLLADTTIEAAAALHESNPRGVGILNNELYGWVSSMSRYRSGGEREFYLASWDGLETTVDRRTSGPLRIPETFLCVGGTTQPAKLPGFYQEGRGQDGFTDRFLAVWPDQEEKPLWNDTEIDLGLLDAYGTAIQRLLALDFALDERRGRIPNTLSLSPEAKDRLFGFFNEENRILCEQASNDALASLHGKYDLHAARLVIPIHLLHWAYQAGEEELPPLEVGLQTVERAIQAAEFFRSQALKCWEHVNNSTPFDELPRDKQTVYEALPETFQRKDGLAIAEKHGIKPKTFFRFLQDRRLFEKVQRGEYEKIS